MHEQNFKQRFASGKAIQGFVFYIGLLSLLAGCSATPSNTVLNSEMPANIAGQIESEDTSDVGLAYILFNGSDYYPVTHWLNGKKLGTQVSAHVIQPLLPGSYKLQTRAETYGLNELEFQIEAGEKLYFITRISRVYSDYIEVPESTFKKKLSRFEAYRKQIYPSTPRVEFLPEAERQTLNTCLNQPTYEACEVVYETIPLVMLKPDQRKTVAGLVEATRAEEARQAIDATLPKPVLKDKYTLALRDALASKDYEESLKLFERLQNLDVTLDPDFDFFYGEALFETGQASEALTVTSRYVRTYGQQANFYQEALQLLNKIDSSL